MVGLNDYMKLFLYDMYLLTNQFVSYPGFFESIDSFIDMNYDKNPKLFNKILYGDGNMKRKKEDLLANCEHQIAYEFLDLLDSSDKVKELYDNIDKNDFKVKDEMLKLAETFISNYLRFISDSRVSKITQ